MKSFINLLALLIVLVACTSATPKRDFTVILYETDLVCVRWKTEDGQINILCKGEDGMPDDLVGIRVIDYNKERDYQDLLINRCRKWKD